MKTLKKTVAVIMAFVMMVLAFSVVAGAQQADVTEKQAAAPFILVHGLGGWGEYDEYNEKSPYWGGGGGMNISDGDVVKILKNEGYEAYAASVGPVSSAWDRACELFAQLTGTVVDYGEAHSKEHNHDRFGKSFVGQPLMGEEWDLSQPLNLVGHSFGGPTIRLFTSLLVFGDEAEVAATGESTSALFTGGHNSAVHSVTTLSGVHNGSQVANMIYDFKPSMYIISYLISTIGAFGSRGAMGDINLGHFGLTPKQDETRVNISPAKVKNFVTSEDNAGYDLTIRGSRELNEKIKLSPYTYYYSYSGYITEKNNCGIQKNTAGCAAIFNGTCVMLSLSQGKTFDGVEMTEEWAINDGMVPLASAKYPLCDADKAYSYEETVENGETITPGIWYYFEPIYGIDHGDYCYSQAGFPDGYDNFYLNLAKTAG
ncbi:MAG: esterase/lipase family protein [Acutalibacteraceae bacterium]